MLFQSKVWLRDLLEGLTDIHNHTIPEIDDGAKALSETEEMVLLYKKLGFKGCIPTPHTMEDYYGNDADKIKKHYNALLDSISEPDFFKGVGSEYMLDGAFAKILEDGDLLTFGESQILFELSYFQKPIHLHESIFKMVSEGLRPILAHPERYNYIQTIEEHHELKKRGCQYQLNLLSLLGHYGKKEKKMAEELLKRDMYDVVGTDAHGPHHLNKLLDGKIPKKLGRHLAKPITYTIANFDTETLG